MKYYTWNPNLLTTSTQTTDRMIFTNQTHDKQTRGTAFRNAAQVRSKKEKKAWIIILSGHHCSHFYHLFMRK